MSTSYEQRAARKGFTLIEILVVITIVAVLIGLGLFAILRVTAVPADVQNAKDIADLSSAADKFYQKYGVYPPSQILLSTTPADYQAAGIGQQSARYLQRIWKKIDLSQSIDWSGGKMQQDLGKANYSVVLQGDQCLVFFLGGVPMLKGVGCQGFADSDTNPANVNAGNKIAPFYPRFEPARLYQRQPQDHVFYSYKDAYGDAQSGQPYAYFSSQSTQFKDNAYNATDCKDLGVQPYFSSVNPFTKFYNPSSCQIISAGRDGKFGTATGQNGVYVKEAPSVDKNGRDDTSNFHDGVLSDPN